MFEYIIPIAKAAETVHSSESGGIGALGIDGTALLFQIINFVLLFYLLKRYAFPSILKILEERRTRIEESLKTAESIEQRSREISKKQTALLHSAQEESKHILADAREQSERLLKEAEIKAKERAEQITADAEGRMQSQMNSIRQELRSETALLIAQATEKIIGQKIDTKQDEKLIESAIKAVQEGK